VNGEESHNTELNTKLHIHPHTNLYKASIPQLTQRPQLTPHYVTLPIEMNNASHQKQINKQTPD
jgi:hypothetical protein